MMPPVLSVTVPLTVVFAWDSTLTSTLNNTTQQPTILLIMFPL